MWEVFPASSEVKLFSTYFKISRRFQEFFISFRNWKKETILLLKLKIGLLNHQFVQQSYQEFIYKEKKKKNLMKSHNNLQNYPLNFSKCYHSLLPVKKILMIHQERDLTQVSFHFNGQDFLSQWIIINFSF